MHLHSDQWPHIASNIHVHLRTTLPFFNKLLDGVCVLQSSVWLGLRSDGEGGRVASSKEHVACTEKGPAFVPQSVLKDVAYAS